MRKPTASVEAMSRRLLILLTLLFAAPLVAQPDRRSVTGYLTTDAVNHPEAGTLQYMLTRCNYAVECKPPAYDWPKDAMVTAGETWADPQTVQWLWNHRGKRVRVTWEVLP